MFARVNVASLENGSRRLINQNCFLAQLVKNGYSNISRETFRIRPVSIGSWGGGGGGGGNHFLSRDAIGR